MFCVSELIIMIIIIIFHVLRLKSGGSGDGAAAVLNCAVQCCSVPHTLTLCINVPATPKPENDT